MIKLLMFDAGATLGNGTMHGEELVVALSPLPEEKVWEESRRFLHCQEFSDEALGDFCEAVHVDPAALPAEWVSDFVPYIYASQAVGRLVDLTGAAAVVVSNVPNTTGPSLMRSLQQKLPMIDSCFTSYMLRRRKPDRRVWQQITGDYGVQPSEAIHFGDRWDEDVRGAIRAGCNAVFVHGTRANNLVPARERWPAGTRRLGLAKTIADGFEFVKELHEA